MRRLPARSAVRCCLPAPSVNVPNCQLPISAITPKNDCCVFEVDLHLFTPFALNAFKFRLPSKLVHPRPVPPPPLLGAPFITPLPRTRPTADKASFVDAVLTQSHSCILWINNRFTTAFPLFHLQRTGPAVTIGLAAVERRPMRSLASLPLLNGRFAIWFCLLRKSQWRKWHSGSVTRFRRTRICLSGCLVRFVDNNLIRTLLARLSRLK